MDRLCPVAFHEVGIVVSAEDPQIPARRLGEPGHHRHRVDRIAAPVLREDQKVPSAGYTACLFHQVVGEPDALGNAVPELAILLHRAQVRLEIRCRLVS